MYDGTEHWIDNHLGVRKKPISGGKSVTKRSMITIRRAVRYALVTGAAVAAASYTSMASAADASTPAQLGKVTVTGTRIKRTSIETAQPITRIGRQQIQKSGFTNIGQLLGRLSFAGGHASRAGVFTSGITQVNLRSLGANRNLVLVNGKRWIQGLGGATNLNTIPTSLIDHIEILQDGASAVYGSDAIAGVVNIITIKNFRGAEAHAYYGIHNDHKTGSWDGQVKQYDFTVGDGNDRGNVVFNVTYREKNGIPQGARYITRTQYPGLPAYVGGSSVTPRGRFALFGPAVSGRTFGQAHCGTYDPNSPLDTLCNMTLINAPAKPSLQNFRDYNATDQWGGSPLENTLTAPVKTVSTYVQGHYDLFDNVTFTANAAYIRDEATQHFTKTEIFAGLQSSKKANGKVYGISKSNPYNPFGVDLVANSNDPCIAAGTCIGLNLISRRPLESEQRTHDFNRDYFHIFAGFNGFVNLFNREIDWDIGFAQNRLQSATIYTGQWDNVHVKNALGPASKCTSSCVPLNLFGGSVTGGGGSITQDQLNYILTERHGITQSNLRDWTANLSSDLYNLPAGPLGLAIGYERVDNYGYDHPGSLAVQGNDSDTTSPQTNGRVVRDAEYAELNIPLFANRPGAKSLSIDVANRWTQFKRSGSVGIQNISTFAHNSSGRLNIRWQPITDLLLRASWSQGFRSPNITELFGGLGNGYTGITNPCAPPPNGGYTGGPLPPNCPGGRVGAQPGPNINDTTGSNAHLKPESSLSRTVGFVYSPSQVPGLDINADYFKIELTNEIGTIGDQNIISACFNSFSFCNLITLKGTQITDIRNVDTNVGVQLNEGIDVGIHYKFPSTPFGDFDARINGTFLKVYDSTKVNRSTRTGFATSHLAGASGHPRRRFNGYLDWDYGNWSAQYRIEYYGSGIGRCSTSFDHYCTYPNRTTDYQGLPGGFSLGRQHLGAMVYHDIHVAYAVPSINTTFALGVNNLFDKKPPPGGGGQYNTGLYRLPSRLLYGSIRVKF
jgi:outer membrane receptor protein involved in Fe transport